MYVKDVVGRFHRSQWLIMDNDNIKIKFKFPESTRIATDEDLNKYVTFQGVTRDNNLNMFADIDRDIVFDLSYRQVNGEIIAIAVHAKEML